MLSDDLLAANCHYFWKVKQRNHRLLLYFIAGTILATIGLQLYWNIQNYQVNKQRLLNEVQISLDNGVEAYYSDLAKTDFFAFISDSIGGLHLSKKNISFWDHLSNDSTYIEIKEDKDSVRVFAGMKKLAQLLDSGKTVSTRTTSMHSSNSPASIAMFQGKKQVDSIKGIRNLTNKIIFSITRDTINFKRLDSLLQKELSRKEIAIDYLLKHFENDSMIGSFSAGTDSDFQLNTFSKSTYLPREQQLQLFYSNPTMAILKRSLASIGLSLLLSACIISCLLYLLYTVNKQKELAEIKNDLISNITHEFKTPIATVFTAIEGIKNFNDANDTEKTNNYLDISHQQLTKLNQMVEKLLETATLDSDKLLLNKEEVDLVFQLKTMVEKYQLLSDGKRLGFKANVSELSFQIDPFHFENAIANLIDNAIKYGGDTIEVNLNSLLERVEITVADNGVGIDKGQRDKVFDKFYRIPTGNRHDVKGFGIGLFYTKKIIEKHEGTIELVPDTKNTLFKITL